MATQPLGNQPDPFVSVDTYLSTIYEPDCEYGEGVVVERNLGEFEHAFLQGILVTLFNNNIDSWGSFALPEQRVQVSLRNFLIPDVCVLRLGAPTNPIVTHPPLIVIEIVSPQDTFRRLQEKIALYLEFGIENVWIIDPSKRLAYRATGSGLEVAPQNELRIDRAPIAVHVNELFKKLDQIRAGTMQ
jgi:Uma2 family endonuclease